jgi:hypothetical protein
MRRIAFIYLLIVSTLTFLNCGHNTKTTQVNDSAIKYKSPRVLIITSGNQDGAGTISKGVITTLEALNSLGCRVILDNRSILYQPEKLKLYTHIYAPTLHGYNDADKKFSLTFLDSIALDNIVSWVADGGVLVAAENFGRNDDNGSDRIALYGKLTADNWPLAKVFGHSFEEINFDSSSFELDSLNPIAQAWPSDRRSFVMKEPGWLLAPSDGRDSGLTGDWAYWKKQGRFIPAAVSYRFGKGRAIYLSLSLILHPITDGGLSTPMEIEKFWQRVIQFQFDNMETPLISINPWPGKYQAALAVTLNAEGSEKHLMSVLDSILDAGGSATLFIHGPLDNTVLKILKSKTGLEIASSGYAIDNFSDAGFETIREDILKAEQTYGGRVKGFRFPHLRRSYNTIQLLNDLEYHYESSLVSGSADNLSGSIIPYNIPIFNQNGAFYSTDILELSPIEKDDWAFYGSGITSPNYAVANQLSDGELYGEYLNSLLYEKIVPYNGLMVQLGYPDYEGYSEYTLNPLLDFIRKAKSSEDIWIANLTEIAQFWRTRNEIDISVSWENNMASCTIKTDSLINAMRYFLKIYAPEGLRLQKIRVKNHTEIAFIANTDGSYLIPLSANEIDLIFSKI